MLADADRFLMIGTRVMCLGILLYTSVSVSVQSVVAALLLFASVFLIKPTKAALVIRSVALDLTKNPFKKQLPRAKLEVPEATVAAFQALLAEYMTYDAKEVRALVNFRVIQSQSQCSFAKTARLWGSTDYQLKLTLEENIMRSIPTFLKFTCFCRDLCLDGFVFEFPGSIYGKNIQTLGDVVRQLLSTLSRSDRGRRDSFEEQEVDDKRWVFEYSRVTFFITSFSPCYPSTNSRFAFGAEDVYVLMQPEVSFAIHDLPFDSPDTDWSRLRTIRDRIRVAFLEAGRPYSIPSSAAPRPMAHDIVKPIQEGDSVIKWWLESGDGTE